MSNLLLPNFSKWGALYPLRSLPQLLIRLSGPLTAHTPVSPTLPNDPAIDPCLGELAAYLSLILANIVAASGYL